MKNKTYICDNCGKGFTEKTNLARHRKTVCKKTGKNIYYSKRYICQRLGCGAKFKRELQLRHHMTEECVGAVEPFFDESSKMFKCGLPGCDMSSSKKGNIVRHMMERRCQDLKEVKKICKPSCQVCGKMFFTAYNVTRHMKAIHAESLYVCIYFTFSQVT